jgi:hypothetical protein
MHIKIRELYLNLWLLLPQIVLFSGYVFLGRSLYNFHRQDATPNPLLLIVVGLCVAGVWALPQNVGGIIASLGCLILTFFWAGPAPCAIATLVAAIFIWIGLQNTDSGNADVEKNLTWQEWLAVVITLLLPLPIAIAMLQSFADYMQSLALGGLAGAITILGPQIRSSDLPTKFVFLLLSIITLLGLIIGWLYGSLTYSNIVPG